MKNKPGKIVLSSMLALILALSVALTGCAGESTGDSRRLGQGSEDLEAVAASLQEKYEQNSTVDYTTGESSVARDHEFLISYDFDPIALGMNDYTQIASLYYDAELTQPVSSYYDWASSDKKSYTIEPWEYPSRATYVTDNNKYTYGSTGDSGRLFDRGANVDWGNTGTMYLATKVDKKTGAKLDKPQVQVITVKGELATPNATLNITDDGLVEFTWNAVKDAKAYYIVKFETDEDRVPSSGTVIGQTTDTKWSSEALVDAVTDATFSTNKDFKTFQISEDDWLSADMIEAYKGEYDPTKGAVVSESSANRLFCVIAVNDKGSSMYSPFIDIKDIASLAPYSIAYNMEKLSDEGFSGYVKGINMMPSYRWIVMCDGVMSQRLVNYNFDKVETSTETWYNEKEGAAGEFEKVETDVIKVPYTVEGTSFTGTLVVSDYDKSNMKAQLDAVKKRQESLRTKTGDVKREVVVESDEAPAAEEANKEIVVTENTITANSALSEYLALSMIDGAKVVDLSQFPEALDQEYLADAWAEAFYQNPLVLGVSEAAVSYDGKTFYLNYEDNQSTREKKQDEITQKVDEVTGKIITSSMTDREKEFAINQYLCDTVTYDYDALDNAAKYDYMKVDSSFYDSFTAYGALVKGVGVCASYSASFKLLADAAGLDSVVVTGYLEGTLGHAWNRVDLGEGQWATVDSTNNDMDIMPNALLNASDTAVATTLVEDDLWLMDSALKKYQNESDKNEFYRVEGLFFEQDKVVDELVKQLASNDIAIVRTDYTLTDAQFYKIGEKVAKATNNPALAGCYWMGIVVMANDYSLLVE